MSTAKTLTQALRHAQYDFDADLTLQEFNRLLAPEAAIHLAYPFETLSPEAYVRDALGDLQTAWPDLERRETIVLEGQDSAGATWLGACGYWTGTFTRPWLGLPATGHMAVMRFHEFTKIEQGKIVEMQILWDIPEVMMQSGVWPMGPSLGREFHVPGPASQDGLSVDGSGATALAIVAEMLENLGQFETGGLEAMQLDAAWHRNCAWYGPSGIGTGRGIAGFRNWHQIPFLRAMPNRVGGVSGGHLFAQGSYVGFTAWPGMQATISGDGWLGIAPSDQQITLRSLDFWRVEGAMIRENWVLVDLLDVYSQIGVDVLGRARELAKARIGQLDP